MILKMNDKYTQPVGTCHTVVSATDNHRHTLYKALCTIIFRRHGFEAGLKTILPRAVHPNTNILSASATCLYCHQDEGRVSIRKVAGFRVSNWSNKE